MAIPYRPSASAECVDGDAGKWRDAAGICYNGIAADVVFSGLDIPVGDEIIVGIAYNTRNFGDAPLGEPGPYDSLNVSLSPNAPAVGVDDDANQMFWQTLFGGEDGTWKVSEGWDSFNGLVMTITAQGEPEPEPEPELADTGVADTIGSLLLGGTAAALAGMLLALIAQRRRSSAAEASVL